MMRISLITLGDPGRLTGGYLYHQRMASAAGRHGAQLDFVSLPDRPFPLPVLDGATALRATLARQPDVVLVDSIAAAYLAPALPRRPLPVPLAAVLHQPPGGIDHAPLRATIQAALDTMLYRRAGLLIVASDLLAAQLRERGFAPERLRVVPPGRDPAPPGEPPAGVGPRGSGEVAFLCVANWLPRKGLHTLLDAFAALPARSGTLHLAGDNRVDPAYTRRIARRLARPDLRGRVRVHGPLSAGAVVALYGACDVFVLPSTKEPYGTVYGEAMAAGLPVVGLRAGNLPYLARDGVEGLLVAPGDTAGLTQALCRLAGDPILRQRMGAAARRAALAWPTWEETAAMFFAAAREAAGLPVFSPKA